MSSLERKLYIVGEIDSESYSTFTKELAALERQSLKNIILELASEGGDAYMSLAFASRIRRSPCDITIIGNGLVASAAVLILACGDKRYMSKETWLMVHEETGDIAGSVHDLEPTVTHYRKMEHQCNSILAEVSKISADQWASYHKATTYFSAAECLQLGIIEGII